MRISKKKNRGERYRNVLIKLKHRERGGYGFIVTS